MYGWHVRMHYCGLWQLLYRILLMLASTGKYGSTVPNRTNHLYVRTYLRFAACYDSCTSPIIAARNYCFSLSFFGRFLPYLAPQCQISIRSMHASAHDGACTRWRRQFDVANHRPDLTQRARCGGRRVSVFGSRLCSWALFTSSIFFFVKY